MVPPWHHTVWCYRYTTRVLFHIIVIYLFYYEYAVKQIELKCFQVDYGHADNKAHPPKKMLKHAYVVHYTLYQN